MENVGGTTSGEALSGYGLCLTDLNENRGSKRLNTPVILAKRCILGVEGMTRFSRLHAGMPGMDKGSDHELGTTIRKIIIKGE